MTSAPVSQMGQISMPTTGKVNRTDSMTENLTGSFQDVMSKTTSGNESKNSDLLSQSSTTEKKTSDLSTQKPTQTVKKIDKNSSGNEKVEDKGSKITSESNTNETEDISEKFNEAGKDLAKEVAEELDVTDEEVTTAMETLGLNFVDLLNPENLKDLTLTLTGESDMMSLLTVDGLGESMQNLLGELNESMDLLTDETGLSMEELADALMKAQNQKIPMGDEMIPESELSNEGIMDELSTNQPDKSSYTVIVEQNGKQVEVNMSEKEDGSKEFTQIVTEVSEEDAPKTIQTLTDRKEEKSENDEGNTRDQSGAFLNQNLQNTSNTETVSSVSTEQLQTTDTQEIMNQILEYMKIQVKPGMDQIEMQLHPASLGTVNIQISAKEGVITAQFTTQNETVKAAIESQMTELKDSLKEQGIKVEAVEVSVESQSFNSQLWQGKGNQESEYGNQQKNSRRMKLNLDELSETEEDELTEEEKITTDMMRKNGNTVDYSA